MDRVLKTDGAQYALGGSHFVRRRTVVPMYGLAHQDFYGFKHKRPECDNAQAKCDAIGMCKELVTGVPGGINGAIACRYMCTNDDNIQR